MINIEWLEKLLETVADHGRELIGIKEGSDKSQFTDALLCHRLVDGKGEATNIALAREILQRWQGKNDGEKLAFLQLLAKQFGFNKAAIEQAIAGYDSDDPKTLARLIALSEAPRQELFRRLNMAPNGTGVLVAMRTFLLEQLPTSPQLQDVDADFRHLLASWFNRGFLQLQRIDWHTSATILEKLIEFEAVHPMEGWDDLRRRLHDKDRRCFGFFHPALPNVPLIFIEVALTCEMSNSIAQLVDPKAQVNEQQQPDTAVFYSINNALSGLRGVSFGNFLIKQVAEELKDEFPQIKRFVTLSPMPLMVKSLQEMFDVNSKRYSAEQRASNIAEISQLLEKDSGSDLGNGNESESQLTWERLEFSVKQDPQLLHKLCLYYLAVLKRTDTALDPVAHFHLSNGACLQRINIAANTSLRGQAESWGCMVNYLYEDERVVSNHEAYVCASSIALSKELQRQFKQLMSTIKSD
ncbi:MAG: malonyl-CoA decarboxylase family protein [Oceanospirillaceae bacterium]